MWLKYMSVPTEVLRKVRITRQSFEDEDEKAVQKEKAWNQRCREAGGGDGGR